MSDAPADELVEAVRDAARATISEFTTESFYTAANIPNRVFRKDGSVAFTGTTDACEDFIDTQAARAAIEAYQKAIGETRPKGTPN